MARIVRFNVLEESHSGDNVFYVHRPYILGNPFTHIKNKETKALFVVKDRDMALRKYDLYFDKMYEENKVFHDEFDKIYEAFMKYDVIYLGCYCGAKESCHGDIIGRKLKQLAIKNFRANNPRKSK